MATHDDSSDIEMVTQPQSLTREANHERATYPNIRGQYRSFRILHHDASQMEIEQDHEASAMLLDSTRTSNNRRYSWWQSIGPISATILIVGTLFILASFFILIIIWKGATDASNRKTPILPDLWRTIVFKDSITQVITICSATIRTSMSLQMGVLVSALAAVMLETSGTRMVDIPGLSIGRIQSSPIGMLPVVLRQATHSLSGAWHTCIIITSVIILLASNLNSTVLLSDLGNSDIPAQHVTNNTGISFNNTIMVIGKDVMSWSAKPKAQWRFAETRFGGNTFGDTGRVYRAFLPFPDEATRASLVYYSGPAVVANTRAICAPLPLYESSIVYNAAQHNGTEYNGTQDIMEFMPGYYLREKRDTRAFECAIRLKAGERKWAVTLCPRPVSGSDRRFANKLNSDTAMVLENEKYLMRNIFIMNTTGDIKSMLENGAIPKRLQKLSSKVEGLWNRLHDTTGVEVLAITSCNYNIAVAGIYNVTMTGDTVPMEPQWVYGLPLKYSIDYSDNLRFMENQTMQVLYQVGIGIETNDTAQRGILELDIEDIAYDSEATKIGMKKNLHNLLNEESVGSKTMWDMTGLPEASAPSANEVYRDVLLTALRITGDPALAIQSVLTRSQQVAYYDHLKYYDLIYPITTMNLTNKLIPVQWLGLGLVMGMAVVHLIQVFVVIIIFLSRTRLSALGNAWQAVAQATHVTKAVESSETDLDKDIKEWAEANGHDKDIYVLSPSPQAGKVELRRRQRKG